MTRELELEDAAGGDPTEEVGPSEAEMGALGAETSPGENDAPPEGSQVEFSSELDDAYEPAPGMMVPHPTDGMPYPDNEGGSLPTAPAFTIDNLVCVEDDRTFVEVWFDECEPVLEYDAPLVADTPTELLRSRYDANGARRERMVFAPSEVIERWGYWWVRDEDLPVADANGAPQLRRVRPAREQCVHYQCQMMNNDEVDDPKAFGHRIIFRNCAARRSVGGALMSLRDQAVYACSYRQPRDEKTDREFEANQRARLHNATTAEKLPFIKPTTKKEE